MFSVWSRKKTRAALVICSTAEWGSKIICWVLSFHPGIHPTSSLFFLTLSASPLLKCLCTQSPCYIYIFFFFSYSPFISALILLLVCWQRRSRFNCGFWRAPCVWSRHGRCQGGHGRSSLAACLAGCGAAAGGRAWMDTWMNKWMDGHELLACSLIFVCWSRALILLSLSLCGRVLTTHISCRTPLAQSCSCCLSEMTIHLLCSSFLTLNTVVGLVPKALDF